MTSNKKNFSIHSVLTLILILPVFLISCEKPTSNPQPSPIEVSTNLLIGGIWSLVSVKVDGVDRSDLFSGMEIRFTSDGDVHSAQISNGAPIWPLNAGWFFKDSQAKFMRFGTLDITLLSLTENTFEAQLQWSKNTLGEGKVASISGQYVFTFKR